VDPYARRHEAQRSFISVGSTHPPVKERVAILRALSGAGFRDYQGAFMKVTKGSTLIPERMLRDKSPVSFRQASAPEAEPTTKQKRRDIGDLIMAAGGFTFLTCACGLKMKVPPTLGKTNVPCPRCGQMLLLPSVTAGITHDGPEPAQKETAEEAPLFYERQSNGWESFACACGHPIQLSPLFRSQVIACRNCGRMIEVRYPGAIR